MARNRLWSQLRALEKRAPKPIEPLTVLARIFAPNIRKDGTWGPPIDCGIYERVTVRPYRDAITERFDPPIPEGELPAEIDPVAVARFLAGAAAEYEATLDD